MLRIQVKPELDSLEDATAFFEDALSDGGAPMGVVMQINVVVDEVFSNIVHYSGAADVTLECDVEGKSLTMRFCDDGMPYDPLKKEDPDVTLGLEEREIGGLGIFMVKKMMDSVEYIREDGRNVLTLKKRWP